MQMSSLELINIHARREWRFRFAKLAGADRRCFQCIPAPGDSPLLGCLASICKQMGVVVVSVTGLLSGCIA